MKGLLYLFVCLCVCISLVSCEDEEDNAIKLTINTSAYDVVKGLKSVDGNLLFRLCFQQERHNTVLRQTASGKDL